MFLISQSRENKIPKVKKKIQSNIIKHDKIIMVTLPTLGSDSFFVPTILYYLYKDSIILLVLFLYTDVLWHFGCQFRVLAIPPCTASS